jgi:hypothetical protein
LSTVRAAVTVYEVLCHLRDELRRIDPAVGALTPADWRRSQLQRCANPACRVVLVGKKIVKGRCGPCYEYRRVHGCETPGYLVLRRRVQKNQSRENGQT